MNVGITGHQKRRGLNWDWVAVQMRDQLRQLGDVRHAYSSLAVGADQIFATAALDMRIPVVAVIPFKEYERFFSRQELVRYRDLFEHCEQIVLDSGASSPEQAFLEAGRYIVDHSDLLIAVWDGARSEGLGGTADIVDYARGETRQVVHIDPFQRTVTRL